MLGSGCRCLPASDRSPQPTQLGWGLAGGPGALTRTSVVVGWPGPLGGHMGKPVFRESRSHQARGGLQRS